MQAVRVPGAARATPAGAGAPQHHGAVAASGAGADGFGAFDGNALAKERHATPFKLPENGVFAPASGCSRFVFTETGDTDADSQAGTALGGFGAVFDLRSAPTSTTPTAGIARCA